MAHVGTISGSMTMDPSAYIAGLNQAAQATSAFRSSLAAGGRSFGTFGSQADHLAGTMLRFNTSVYASMTAFYALSRTISSSLGVFEEYSNVLGRISATADLSASSVNALSESMKRLNRELGGSRTDLMKGVYTAIQANFTSPSEFMPIGRAAMALRTASGREITTEKGADIISVVRNALGVRSGRETRITDMLLRGRDIGRYKLNEMAGALGIPITVFGNQFSATLGPEETLRQLIAILSATTQTGLQPRVAATGARRLIVKSARLASDPGGLGRNLTEAFSRAGFGSINEELNKGAISYLDKLFRVSGGSPQEITRLGFGDREIMVLSSVLRNRMSQVKQFYGDLSEGEISGTTQKYINQHKDTWWYQRDRLRSAYMDTQLSLMQSLLPSLKSFANSLELVNDLFQKMAPALKQIIGMVAFGAGVSLLKNFYIRCSGGAIGGGIVGGRFGGLKPSAGGLSIPSNFFTPSIGGMAMGLSPIATSSIGNRLYYHMPKDIIDMAMRGGNFTNVGGRRYYNRRDTTGIFVPASYNVRDYHGNLLPYMARGSIPSTSSTSFRERMLDRAILATGAMSKFANSLPSSSGLSSIPGMTSAIKAGAFMFGGQDYRVERIQDKYNSRIAAANEALKSGRMSAYRSASGLYKTLTGAGMGDVRASSEAANHLNRALTDVNKKFDQTAASAQRSARFVGGFSNVLNSFGAVLNMAKIGVIIKVISDLINGFNLPGNSSKHAGVIDLSKAGTDESGFNLNDSFRRISDEIKYVGIFLHGYANLKTKSENTALVMEDMISRRASLGYVLNEDYNPKGLDIDFRPVADRVFRPATLEDAMKSAMRENLSPKEQTKVTRAGYNNLTPKVQREFQDYLMSGKLGQKYTGVTEPGFGQRTNIEEFEGKSGHQVRIDFFTSFLKEIAGLGETIQKTTSSVKNFNMTAKQTDHIIEYLKNNYRAYYLSFISGAKQIETRGRLYDQQADRSLTPNEQSIWRSSGYREKMALAASDLFTPKHRFGGEDNFASFEDWAKQQEENERYSGFDEYEDAKRKYFNASSNEQTASMLAVLLPKLATLSTSDVRKQLEGVYGRNLNLDDVGIDRLRNIDLSRYFSEKPRDQLGGKSQFMSYGTTETYNSIVSMTPPEIIELQANRQAIVDLQDAIVQDSDKLLQDFDSKFEKYVAGKLNKIVDNTGISAKAASFGNTPDLVRSSDN